MFPDCLAAVLCFPVQTVKNVCSCLQTSIAQCDAHELFRHVQEVRGLVVLLRSGTNIPQPDQLAVSLRDKQSPESD